MHSLRLGHESPPDFWDLRSEFWRKEHPAMLNNPFQWTPTTIGYDVIANDDLSTSIGSSVNLSAVVTQNNVPLNNLAASWVKVEGPGKVSISTPNSYATTATFSAPGEYILRFTAIYDPDLDTEYEFFTFSDFVKVMVN